MGRRGIALAFLASFLVALALTAEAITHENFSASSLAVDTIPKDPTETTVTTTKEPTETTVTTEDLNNRFPNGYPGQAHRYNPETQMYETDLSKTTTEPGTVPTEESTETTTIPNRYEAGYTFGPGEKPSSFHQYTTDTQPGYHPDEFTLDPMEGRYKGGYYPKSTYAGASWTTSTTVPNNAVSLTAQNSNQLTTSLQGDLTHRYERGYFANSAYTQQGSMYNKQETNPMSYNSYTGGQFSTLPYPSSGIPFVPSGAGCRTAYWVQNVQMWPSFFTVKSTVADAFGAKASATFGQTTILQGLMKYGSDPYNELLRNGLTSLLNAYTRGAFESSHMKVIEEFNAALVSPDAAKTQALAFQTQNVESISAGAACT